MIGSMVSSLFTIYLVLALPELKYLFLLAIIPYLLDIILILSYPKSLNERKDTTFHFKSFIKENKNAISYVIHDKKMRNILFRSSSYQAMFKILKDFVQLILVAIPISIFVFHDLTEDEHIRVYSAIMYAVIFLISAITSRNAYKLLKVHSSKHIIALMWGLSGIATLIIGLFIHHLVVVFIGFIFMYVFLNIRKPLMVEMIGDYANPEKRASVLSIDSQLTSLFIVVFAPILGLVADYISYQFMFIFVGCMMIGIYSLITRHDFNNHKEKEHINET